MSVQRTAMGKAVDMSVLVTRNEKTRAVGNMGVNARGDILDSQNRVVKDNTSRVKAQYAKTVESNIRSDVDTGMSFGGAEPSHPVEMTDEEKQLNQEWNDDGDVQP